MVIINFANNIHRFSNKEEKYKANWENNKLNINKKTLHVRWSADIRMLHKMKQDIKACSYFQMQAQFPNLIINLITYHWNLQFIYQTTPTWILTLGLGHCRVNVKYDCNFSQNRCKWNNKNITANLLLEEYVSTQNSFTKNVSAMCFRVCWSRKRMTMSWTIFSLLVWVGYCHSYH